MGSFRFIGLRRFGLIALFCAYALNLAAWGIQTGRSLEETTAADAAITAPDVIATCPHHPHGCPKDCMCPKTYVTVVNGDAHDDDSGGLTGTALVTCTEQGPQSLTPSFAVFIPGMKENLPAFSAGIPLTPEKKKPPFPIFFRPLRKKFPSFKITPST